MEKKARYIELRTTEGKPIVSFYLFEKEVILDKPDPPAGAKKDPGKEKGQNGNDQANDSLMTPAQKRYLFRILAEQGIEGDEAHEHLKKLFDVDALKEITKFEASRMIERLLNETKGGDDDAGSPF